MESIFCESHDIMLNKTNFEYFYDNMNNMIIVTLVYAFGLTIGGCLVSKYLLDTEVFIENFEEEEQEKEEVYEDKYPLDKSDHLKGNKPTNVTIVEHTPDGSVIMSYNYDKEGFEYWCDNKNIKYKYLETVARKFVKMNFCTDLYVDRKENIQKQKDDIIEMIKKEKEAKEAKEKEAKEAKEKEEKEANGKIDEEFEEIKKEDSVFVINKLSIKEKQKKQIKKKEKISATEANKYIRSGKISEFQWLKKIETTKEKKISFNDFKNNFC